MQQITEGQTNEPVREEGSEESNPSEIYVIPKGIPDELSHEWRVLHPFELPGVRFPMDNTPPNQRRLAENDALVELIQTTKYLEDTLTWGQRDYQLYPPRYGDPFYRGRGRGRGRERREWINERVVERSNGGLGRESSRGNGREINQVHMISPQQDRQKEEWSVPPNTERREDGMERRESSRAPPTSLPIKNRSFTDWSSLDSPTIRTSPQNAAVQDTEHDINQPDNQTVQLGSEPAHVEVTGNTLSDDVTTFSTHQQPNQMGTNTSDIEVRSQRDGARVIDSSTDEEILMYNRNVQIPVSHSNLSLSRHDVELLSGSHIRTQATRRTEMIPQLDGPYQFVLEKESQRM